MKGSKTPILTLRVKPKTLITIFLIITLTLTTQKLTDQNSLKEHNSARKLQIQMTQVSYNVQGLGRWIGFSLKILQVLMLFAMVADVFSRFGGKPLKLMELMRFVVFHFGVSSTFAIGSYLTDGYRGYNGFYFNQWMVKIYGINEGYFELGQLKMFRVPNVNGVDYGFNFLNVVFFELCIYLILFICSVSTMALLKIT